MSSASKGICPYCRKEKNADDFGFYKNSEGTATRNETCKSCVEVDNEITARADREAIRYLKSVGAWPTE